MLHVIDNLGIYPFLVVLFFISLTNFKAHRQGLAKKRREEKGEFKWARGLYMVIPVVGMVAVAFICGLYTWLLWTSPPGELPQSAAQSKYWEFWLYLGLIFPAFMVVPGLLYWGLRGRKKTLPIPGMPVKQELAEQRAEVFTKKKGKKQKKPKKEKPPKKEKKSKKEEKKETEPIKNETITNKED